MIKSKHIKAEVLKLFLFFGIFEPRCSYKIVLIKEKECKLIVCLLSCFLALLLGPPSFLGFFGVEKYFDSSLWKLIPLNLSNKLFSCLFLSRHQKSQSYFSNPFYSTNEEIVLNAMTTLIYLVTPATKKGYHVFQNWLLYFVPTYILGAI